VTRRRLQFGDERGLIAVFTAITLTLMLGILAIVLDLGNARQERRQAQVSADAAVLAVTDYISHQGFDTSSPTSDQWATAVTMVKNFAKANFNTTSSSWVGCTDSSALSYQPDGADNDACISASFQNWPAIATGETTKQMFIRIRIPTDSINTYFGKVFGASSLSLQASATAVVTRTTQWITNTVSTPGGPCAICLLGPTGLTLNGQNGNITVTGGNVVVDSTSSTVASLNPNGYVHLTTAGGAIGGPAGPNAFTGSGFSPAPTTLNAVTDPLANVPQCGNGSPGTTNYCPTNFGSNGTTNGATLSPGIYSTIRKSHTLNPGIYVITSGISLSGNDLVQGNGVMLYMACSNYPAPCAAGAQGASIKTTGNGAFHLSPPTATQCTTQPSVCPYVGMMYFADRNNASLTTFRGNGTNENGGIFGSYGTIYAKAGEVSLTGNGFTLDSQIVANSMTMDGNPSGLTVAYDLNYNAPETTTTTTTSSASSLDNNGLTG
jgi:hypothetical protein